MPHLTLRAGAVAVGVLAGGAVAGVLAWALETQSYNIWGAVIVVPPVIALNAVLIWHVSRRNVEPWLSTVMGMALAAKVAGALTRYFVAYVVYNGVADAEGYNLYAAANYGLWREGFIAWEWGGKQGTQYMQLITTAIYTAIGPSPLAAFVVFGMFAFWGQYLLFRAFRIALPTGNGRRYAVLVLLLPSMLYWPASIGKESWLMLFVGVTALGAAKLFTSQSGAFALLAVGAVGTAIVRPHVAVLLFAALLIAQVLRPTAGHPTGPMAKLGGVLVLGSAALVLMSQSAAFLGIDDLTWQALSESVDWAGDQTGQGGSAFTPVPIGSPWGVVAATLTVLFRPFPWEAGNIQMLLQSLEGVALIVLAIKAWPQLRRLPSILRQNPYLLFSVIYLAGFIWAFSGFGNFGILARQRVLMLPFFLVLLALPPTVQAVTGRRTDQELDDVRS